MTEMEMLEYLQDVEATLKSEMTDFFIVASGKGRTGFFCKGAVENLVSDGLEVLYATDPEKATRTLRNLLLKVCEWYPLENDEKVLH